MANMSGWSDADFAEELGDFINNDEDLYNELQKMGGRCYESDAIAFLEKAAARYNWEIQAGRPPINFGGAMLILAPQVVAGEL